MANTATDISTILSKVKKLLALSTSSNPNEAALAASKAQELLMLHNLSMSQIDTQEPSRYEKESLKVGRRVWRRILLQTVAEVNFCKMLYNTATSESILIGETYNREVVTYLYQYLVEQLEPMAYHAYHRSLSSLKAVPWMDSFYIGAIESIDHRLQEQQREMAAADNACKALVISKEAELRKAVNTFFPNTRVGSAKRVRSMDGVQAGREAGRNVAINKGIKEG